MTQNNLEHSCGPDCQKCSPLARQQHLELAVTILGHDREYLINALKEIYNWLGDGPCSAGAGSRGDGQRFHFVIREVPKRYMEVK